MRRIIQRLSRIVVTIPLIILLTSALGWLVLVLSLQSSKYHFLILIAGLVPFYYAAVLVHELGHLVGGLAAGFQITQFQVGPVQLLRTRGLMRPQLVNPLRHLPGLVRANVDQEFTTRRIGVFIAAGPVASLLGAALLLGLAYEFSERVMTEWPRHPWSFWQRLMLPRNAVSGWLQIAAITNLVILLATVVPGQTLGYLSDGAQLIDLIWGGLTVKTRWLVARLASALLNGVRPRDWDQTCVQRLLAMRAGERSDSLTNLYGYYYFLDRGWLERAGELLDLALAQRSGCPYAVREGIFVEAAYYEGRYRKNAVVARRWFDLLENGKSEEHTQLRAEAAVLFAEGKLEESATKSEAALQAAPRSKDPGGALAEADWIRGLFAELQRLARGSDPAAASTEGLPESAKTSNNLT